MVVVMMIGSWRATAESAPRPYAGAVPRGGLAGADSDPSPPTPPDGVRAASSPRSVPVCTVRVAVGLVEADVEHAERCWPRHCVAVRGERLSSSRDWRRP